MVVKRLLPRDHGVAQVDIFSFLGFVLSQSLLQFFHGKNYIIDQ